MKHIKGIMGLFFLILILGLGINACGSGNSASWKEEVLLHDGTKIVAERSVSRGGRHEIGQKPPYKEQSLVFTMPGSNRQVTWEDTFSEDVGSANFLPMLLDVSNDVAYLVARPMGCLSYNKWGRPNPPYVIFKYDGKVWQRIQLQELPTEIQTPNLISSMPDIEMEKAGTRFISAAMITKITSRYKKPENKAILREPLTKERINQMCMEMILYKGFWIMPNDPIARKMVDEKS